MIKVSNRVIIYITIVSLIGLIVSQYFIFYKSLENQNEKTAILKKQIILQNKEFKSNVIISLTKVRDRLISLNKEAEGIYLEPVLQINPNYFVVSFYDTLDKHTLNDFIEEEFKNFDITQEFKLGVYDCFTDSIIFDEYVDQSKDEQEYVPQKWDHDGYYFGVYFHDKQDFKLPESQSVPYILIFSSLLIIIVVVFFGYTTNTILKQKKISDITTDFINNMTHELKTPISTISLSVDVMGKSLKDKEDEISARLNRYINVIKTENKRLENQVERVLRIAKLERGEINLNIEELDIHAIILGCVETFSVPIQERQGKLSLNLLAKQTKINGDIIHITNIVYNLLDNANKYSEREPDITIQTENGENQIKIVISDKGKGISKEDLKFIFKKFYRVSTGDVHNIKGFGLGLYYVKEMILKHNGQIAVKSKLGEGTTFVISLPTT